MNIVTVMFWQGGTNGMADLPENPEHQDVVDCLWQMGFEVGQLAGLQDIATTGRAWWSLHYSGLRDQVICLTLPLLLLALRYCCCLVLGALALAQLHLPPQTRPSRLTPSPSSHGPSSASRVPLYNTASTHCLGDNSSRRRSRLLGHNNRCRTALKSDQVRVHGGNPVADLTPRFISSNRKAPRPVQLCGHHAQHGRGTRHGHSVKASRPVGLCGAQVHGLRTRGDLIIRMTAALLMFHHKSTKSSCNIKSRRLPKATAVRVQMNPSSTRDGRTCNSGISSNRALPRRRSPLPQPRVGVPGS